MDGSQMISRTNWRLRLKQLAMRTACHPLVGHLVAGWTCDQVRNRGCLIDTSHPSVSASVKASLFWGAFEKSEVLFVQKYLAPQYDVIELGSGIGVVSSHIARRLDRDRRMVCVEANPEIASWITHNVQQNAAIRPLVVQAAIDYSGASHLEMTLAARHLDSGLAQTRPQTESMQARRDPQPPADRCVQVPVTRLCDLWEQIQMAPFSLVADIEGAELGILEHEDLCLRKCQGMVIELHAVQRPNGTLVTVEELLEIIKKRHQFQLVARRGDVFAFSREAASTYHQG